MPGTSMQIAALSPNQKAGKATELTGKQQARLKATEGVTVWAAGGRKRVHVDPLTTEESGRRAELERLISESVFGAWQAYTEIRDRRLYRTTHATFEDYCEDVWGMSKTHMNRQIMAAKVVQVLAPIGFHVTTERVARAFGPLVKLYEPADEYEPEELADKQRALEAVVKEVGEHPTAEAVDKAVAKQLDALDETLPKPRSKKAKGAAKPRQTTPQALIKNTEDTFNTAVECLKSLKVHEVLTAQQANSLLTALNKITDQLWKHVAENEG